MSIEYVRLSSADAAKLKAAAVTAGPEECCGLLLGAAEGGLTVTRIVPMTNVAPDKERSFALDPQAQFDVLRAARAAGERVIGHYHSHPNGHEALSARDLAMAHDPGAVWVLVAMADGKARDPRAFVRDAEASQFRELAVRQIP